MSQTTLHKHISRLMALLLTMMLLLPCIPAVHAEEGTCGDSLTWSFANGQLTISGTGAMYDYSDRNKAPWDSFSAAIYYLSLPDGLTRIGNRAFYGCTGLVSVTVPGSVEEIGDAAFCKSSGITMLSLNSGLRTIGRSAFESCTSLQELRIPNTVIEVGDHAFYCCESLSYAHIPSSVHTLGSGIFSYCTRLSRVDMDVPASSLPGWSFYGCDMLSQIHVEGSSVNADQFKQTSSPVPLNPQPSNPSGMEGSSGGIGPIPPAGDMDEQEQTGTLENGGSVTGTLVGKTDNSIITNDITVTQTGDSSSVDIDISATVITPDGWNEVVDHIQSIQGTGQTENGEQSGKDDETADVTIYVPDDSVIPGEVLKELAGTNTNLTINTSSGTKFKIDCTELDAESIEADLDLSYTLTLLETVPDKIASSLAYKLVFHNASNVKVEVMIRLPMENARRAASLYQMRAGGDYNFLQSVVVDNEAYAHYYLGNIESEKEYLIAMDVQGEQSAQAIIPENLYDEYRLVDHSTGKEYVITGRKSSWNMGLGKVMAILAVVMVSAIVVIGFVMYFWNKQRLKNGYVPKWDDEE